MTGKKSCFYNKREYRKFGREGCATCSPPPCDPGELRADAFPAQGHRITWWKFKMSLSNKFQTQIKPFFTDHSPDMLLTTPSPCCSPRGTRASEHRFQVSTLPVPER